MTNTSETTDRKRTPFIIALAVGAVLLAAFIALMISLQPGSYSNRNSYIYNMDANASINTEKTNVEACVKDATVSFVFINTVVSTPGAKAFTGATACYKVDETPETVAAALDDRSVRGLYVDSKGQASFSSSDDAEPLLFTYVEAKQLG